MRTFLRIFLAFFFAIVLLLVLILGFLGFIPGLSSILGSDKPKDLGIKYTQADVDSGRSKSQLEYLAINEPVSSENSIQWSGTREVNIELTSAQLTGIMNTKPWKYYPYKNVQVKFNGDGSAEVSGSLVKNNIPVYASTFQAPQVAVDFAMKFLPENPTFYLKGRAALTENKVSLFEPQVFQIGKIPMPLNMFLSFVEPSLVKEAYAIDLNEMSQELSKVSNKRQLIIDFIDSRLANINGFYAKNARITENKLIFEGNLSEKEATER